MDDYSKFISNPSEFLIGYKIKNGEIIVNTKKRKIQKYKATKSKIKYYENILEKQYQTIISNQDKILQSKIDVRMAVYSVIAMILCISSALSSEFSDILGMFLCGTSIFSLIICALDNVIYTRKFKSKMKIYADFLNKRNNIEKTFELDKTVIEKLSNESIKNIRYNMELKEQRLIDNIFNIELMDKTTLKDLRNILCIYNNEEFKGIEVKNNVKRKTRRNKG